MNTILRSLYTKSSIIAILHIDQDSFAVEFAIRYVEYVFRVCYIIVAILPSLAYVDKALV